MRRDYISGLTSERKAGVKEGLEQGAKKKQEEMIKSMYDNGMDITTICKVAKMSKSEVEKLLNI